MMKRIISNLLLVLLVSSVRLSTTNAFLGTKSNMSPTRTFYRPSVTGGSSQQLSAATRLKAANFDPSIEAELCTTMAHVALDFTGLFSPSRSLVRLFSVIGRLFAISADYIPDHSIHAEELMIQVFLLGLALRELVTDRGPVPSWMMQSDTSTTNSSNNNALDGRA